jgi:hypothetical protein
MALALAEVANDTALVQVIDKIGSEEKMVQLEVNPTAIKENAPIVLAGGGAVMITPPISGEYWLARVRITQRQAIVCFSKFGTIGVGFQRESDWNTNLPYTCPAEEIYEHIAHNKGRNKATKDDCVSAIKLIQEFAHQFRGTKPAGGNQRAEGHARASSASAAK